MLEMPQPTHTHCTIQSHNNPITQQSSEQLLAPSPWETHLGQRVGDEAAQPALLEENLQ